MAGTCEFLDSASILHELNAITQSPLQEERASRLRRILDQDDFGLGSSALQAGEPMVVRSDGKPASVYPPFALRRRVSRAEDRPYDRQIEFYP